MESAKRAYKWVMVCAVWLLMGGCAGLMESGPKAVVRFHFETSGGVATRNAFSMPLLVGGGERARRIQVEVTPAVTELLVTAYVGTRLDDGTYGGLFKLNGNGRIALEELTSSNRGRSVVVFVGARGKGLRQVMAMRVDRVISDGIIPIPSGLTAKEDEMFRKAFGG
jgi:hypothetical protein